MAEGESLMLTKRCSACSKRAGKNVLHPLYYFYKKKSNKDGLSGECQFAARARSKEIYRRFNGLTGVATL